MFCFLGFSDDGFCRFVVSLDGSSFFFRPVIYICGLDFFGTFMLTRLILSENEV